MTARRKMVTQAALARRVSRWLRQGSAAFLSGAVVVGAVVGWQPSEANAAFVVSIELSKQLRLPSNGRVGQNIFVSDPCEEKYAPLGINNIPHLSAGEVTKLHASFLVRPKDDQ